mmetsp:Transcript_26115/g.46442  ORF Transcript_26115/g.46442 Transcript_26115/m.46442 type:complete len:279 (+) Transcript_26115:831-1667(+)
MSRAATRHREPIKLSQRSRVLGEQSPHIAGVLTGSLDCGDHGAEAGLQRRPPATQQPPAQPIHAWGPLETVRPFSGCLCREVPTLLTFRGPKCPNDAVKWRHKAIRHQTSIHGLKAVAASLEERRSVVALHIRHLPAHSRRRSPAHSAPHLKQRHLQWPPLKQRAACLRRLSQLSEAVDEGAARDAAAENGHADRRNRHSHHALLAVTIWPPSSKEEVSLPLSAAPVLSYVKRKCFYLTQQSVARLAPLMLTYRDFGPDSKLRHAVARRGRSRRSTGK